MESVITSNDTIEILERLYLNKLDCFVSLMSCGNYIDDSINQLRKCDGVILLASNQFCPIYYDAHFSLKPFYIDENVVVHLSMNYIRSPYEMVTLNNTSLKEAVEKYNKMILDDMRFPSTGELAIVAFHSFCFDK